MQHVEDVLQLDTWHDRTVDGLCAAQLLPGEVDAREIRERTAGADNLRAPPVASGDPVLQLAPNMLAQFFHPSTRAGLRQKIFGQTDGAERQRKKMFDQTVGAERQLERAAANIHHDSTSAREVEMGERTSKAEASFVVAAYHLYTQAGFRFYELQKSSPIRCFAHGTGGDRLDTLGTKLSRECGHPVERRYGGQHRGCRQLSRSLDSLAESWRSLHFIDDADVSAGRDVGDDLTDRVGPDVDRRNSNVFFRRAGLGAAGRKVEPDGRNGWVHSGNGDATRFSPRSDA